MIFLSDNPKGLEDNTVMDDIEEANEGNDTIELSKKAFTFFCLRIKRATVIVKQSNYTFNQNTRCKPNRLPFRKEDKKSSQR